MKQCNMQKGCRRKRKANHNFSEKNSQVLEREVKDFERAKGMLLCEITMIYDKRKGGEIKLMVEQ